MVFSEPRASASGGGAGAGLRFLGEARAAAKVKSDHVVTIYQVGEDRGVPFLAMEFLQGEPMDRWLARGRRPSLPQLLRLGREMALGLAAAHERGLIHRDIKPGNVWLEMPTGRVKLLDFGLARAVGADTHLTQFGAIVGTPAYMAPEQARGEKIDHRADLFSLGVVLYRLATGEMPFKGENTMAVLTALAMGTPRPIRSFNPELPASLTELIDRLLAKDPAKRPGTAREVVATLSAIEQNQRQTSEYDSATVMMWPTPSVPSSRLRRRLWPAALLALLLVAALLALLMSRPQTKEGEAIAKAVGWADGGGPPRPAVPLLLPDKEKPFVLVRKKVLVKFRMSDSSAWQGRRNVYTLRRNTRSEPTLFGLSEWRKFWDSPEDGSLDLDDVFVDPRLLRLLPGQAKRPDGKDYGADVDRILGDSP